MLIYCAFSIPRTSTLYQKHQKVSVSGDFDPRLPTLTSPSDPTGGLPSPRPPLPIVQILNTGLIGAKHPFEGSCPYLVMCSCVPVRQTN